MEFDDRALPLTRGQLDIWLAQETGQSGTDWQLGVLVRFEIHPQTFNDLRPEIESLARMRRMSE